MRTPNELELQARWFAGDFGKNFVGATGDKIDIVQFGTWNRESGPDFSDAAISVNGSESLRGCIEIDLVDRNWDLHGHSVNPAFEETVLHVFVDKSDREFFSRTKSNRNVPQIRIAVEKFFAGLDHPFWKFHYTLTADASAEPMALVGESRVADILANVIFPFWRTEDVDVWPEYSKLCAGLTNRRLETEATRLFGDNLRRREFTKTIAHQQALLQIYEDFCLQDKF